jgi:hypothetical protein
MSAVKAWMKAINSVLHREWAPIAGEPPEDEYESYVGSLAAMLLKHAPDADLLAYLEWAEVENIGLGGPFARERAEKVIASLRALPLPADK